MDGGNTSQNSVTSNTAPWSGAQPYLTDLMSQASGLYNAGSAYAPFSTVAPFSNQTQQGLDAVMQRAQNGSPVTQAANSSLINLLQSRSAPGAEQLQSLMQGYNDPGASTLQSLSQGYSDPGADLTRQGGTMANPAMSAAASFAGGGGPGAGTMAQWADRSNINPYLDAQYRAASRPVIDSINAQFSNAGRTGSTANQDALTSRLGDLAANIYAPGYENAANRSLSAAGQLQNSALTGANMLGNLSQQQAVNLLNAGNQLSNSAYQQAGLRSNAANALSANANTQANFRANAANMLNNNANTQASQTIAGAALAPQLAGQDYTDLQNMLSVGGQYDSQAQRYIDDALQRWNFSQNRPWDLLNNYRGVISGLGSLGGQTTSTGNVTQPGQSIIPSLVGSGINLLASPTSSGSSIFANLLNL